MTDLVKPNMTLTSPTVEALAASTSWGSALWTFLYITAATKFDLVSSEQFLTTLQSLSLSLPCAKCQKHLKDYMAVHGNALVAASSSFDRVVWVSLLENDVRKMLNERPLTLEALLNLHRLPTPDPLHSLKPIAPGLPHQEMLAMKATPPQRRCCQRSLASGSSFLGIRRSVRELRITG